MEVDRKSFCRSLQEKDVSNAGESKRGTRWRGVDGVTRVGLTILETVMEHDTAPKFVLGFEKAEGCS